MPFFGVKNNILEGIGEAVSHQPSHLEEQDRFHHGVHVEPRRVAQEFDVPASALAHRAEQLRLALADCAPA